jgi:hypothetical protein
MPQQSTAGQEVDAATPQLAGARAGENEARRRPQALDQPVDDVEQLRHFLDLVDDDHLGSRARRQALAQAFRTRRVLAVLSGISRSIHTASGKRSRSQVDLPVPRGPRRKKLEPGAWKNRLIVVIFTAAPSVKLLF